MGLEIEAKMKVPDFGPTIEQLTSAGASPQSDVFETNIFFDTDDRSLLAKDQGLRLRTIHPLDGGASTHTVTFKGPRQHGPLKTREERELGVDDAKDAIALLEVIGYRRILTFDKKRQSWSLKDCRVELDELPHIGRYVEIEGPSESSVMAVRELLKLGERPLLKTSYVALLITYLQEQGQTKRQVKFDAVV